MGSIYLSLSSCSPQKKCTLISAYQPPCRLDFQKAAFLNSILAWQPFFSQWYPSERKLQDAELCAAFLCIYHSQQNPEDFEPQVKIIGWPPGLLRHRDCWTCNPSKEDDLWKLKVSLPENQKAKYLRENCFTPTKPPTAIPPSAPAMAAVRTPAAALYAAPVARPAMILLLISSSVPRK